MKVADLTVDELKAIIRETLEEKLRECLDPDYGLELREETVEKLKISIASKERIPFKEVKRRLGLA